MTTRQPDPRADAGPTGLADTIARLRRALRRAARAADPANTLAVAQLELLGCVSDHPGIRPSQLARLLNLRPNTVTTLVNGLAAQEMIGRAAAAEDGRAITLTATETGRQAVRSWQDTNNDLLDRALPTLTVAQRRALASAVPALDALSTAIDRLADAGTGTD